MRRGPRASVLAAAAAVLALVAACGVPEAGAAAVVGDRRISETELQQATAQVQTLQDARGSAGGVAPERVQESTVLTFLILGPYLEESAQKAGAGVSDSDARDVIAGALGEPGPSTVDYVRASLAVAHLQRLGQEPFQKALTEVGERAKAAAPRVNPRYGAWVWDGRNTPIVNATQNWIVPSPSPSPSGQPAEGGAEPAPQESPSP